VAHREEKAEPVRRADGSQPFRSIPIPPHAAAGSDRSRSSFACMKKVVLILAVAVVVAASVFYVQRSRVRSAQPCWGKLVNIEAAKEQWAIESKATSGTPVTIENILPYLGSMPTCHVASATYIIGKVGEEPRCTVHGTVSHFNPDRY
jgi:hypothetical protein